MRPGRSRRLAIVVGFAVALMACHAEVEDAGDTSIESDAVGSLNPGGVYVQYHLWYNDAQPADGLPAWHGWDQLAAMAQVDGGVTPESILHPMPWRRVTTSRLGLPLVGAYSSTSEQVVRHHFRSARAAGIDGMFASVYDGGWLSRFSNHLGWAEAEGMPLAVELYHGVGPDAAAVPMRASGCVIQRQWQEDWMTHVLAQFGQHAAYLRVDGRPAVWIANGLSSIEAFHSRWPTSDCQPRAYFSWGDRQELETLLDRVRARLGGVDPYVIMTGPRLDDHGRKFAAVHQVEHVVTASNIGVFWNRFGYDSEVTRGLGAGDRAGFESAYRQEIAAAETDTTTESKRALALHVYPAFDERGLFPTSVDRGSGLGHARHVITRGGNGMYDPGDGFLAASLAMARWYEAPVFLESWNDWNEQTQVEPGFHFSGYRHHENPYSALDRIAAHKGVSPSFTSPPVAAIDERLRRFCRQEQLTGKRVILRGTMGLKDGASLSDGVAFSVSYTDDDVSTQAPSHRYSHLWRNYAWIEEHYDGELTSFEVDLTPILDERDLVFGIESLADTGWDWIYLTRFELDWYGHTINLIDEALMTPMNWHSREGHVPWGVADPRGTLAIMPDVPMENGDTAPRALYLHPDYAQGDGGFMHAGLNWSGIAGKLEECQ